MKQDKQHALFIMAVIFMIVSVLTVLAWCAWKPPPDWSGITPTLAISETPSITPVPPTPTATHTPFVTLSPPDVATLTATPSPLAVTAVISPSITAVTPSPTATGTATPTQSVESPTPTELPEVYTVVRDDYLISIATILYGDGGQWRCLYDQNRDIIEDPNLIFAGERLKGVRGCKR